MVIFWLILMILFLIIEAATVGLTSIWFATGALAALIVASLDGQIWLQITFFIIVSGLMLVFTRPLAKKYLNVKKNPTNADRVLSMIGIVTEDIDNILNVGAVTVGGKTWSARSVSGETIEKGIKVKPMGIEGVKLIVAPVPAHEETNRI